MLSHLWAHSDPFQWREVLTYTHAGIYFCAVCQTCCCPPDAEARATLSTTNGTRSIDEADLAWLGSTRIIGAHAAPGKNAVRHPVSSVFTTGVLRSDDHGLVQFRASPQDFGLTTEQGDKEGIECDIHISKDELQQICMPTLAAGAACYLRVHENCYTILEQTWKHMLGTGRENNYGESFAVGPDLFSSLKGRAWTVDKLICNSRVLKGTSERANTGIDVYDPLVDYHASICQKIPTTKPMSPLQRHLSTGSFQRDDIFSKLPIELMLQIASQLRYTDIESWGHASVSAAYGLNNCEYWTGKIAKEMPWLWDFNPTILISQASSKSMIVDWFGVYLNLLSKQRRPLGAMFPGIENRAKIWSQCFAFLVGTMRHGQID